MTTPIWTPTKERVEQANITRFNLHLCKKLGLNFGSYAELWNWSVSNKELFWEECREFCGIKFTATPTSTYTPPIAGSKIPRGSWFPNGTLNFAEHLLRGLPEQEALVSIAEGVPRKSVTFSELSQQVSKVRAFLIESGVQVGDRVAAFLPNGIEAVTAMLATTSLGALWSSTSPDFGVQGVIDRFSQIEPKVLFATDGYYYAGKLQRTADRVSEITSKLPSLKKLVIVSQVDELRGSIQGLTFAELLTTKRAQSIEHAALPFDHPAFILYSSGTTGVPKCIVHGAGGTLLQHLKELVLHTDLKPTDKILYTTTCGWMMWNWLVSSLAVGATVYLYDGSLFHPNPETVIDILEREKISVFGTGAKYLLLLEKSGVKPRTLYPLECLKTILSTGSALPPSSYSFIYNDFKRELCLSSISGGTDIISCFALGNPTLPVYPGELQSLGLGMDVQILNDQQLPIKNEAGELCCKPPFPSMPISFWNDPQAEKYFLSYFEGIQGYWKHGDWAELTEHNGLIIHGRSDATLNPGGVRIGTAEIYRIVETIPEILESVVTAQKWESDERIVLFIKLQIGQKLDQALIERIVSTIRHQLSPRHIPAKILQVLDIPRTLSGKIVELAIRDVIHGREIRNKDALANPEALDYFRDRPELAN